MNQQMVLSTVAAVGALTVLLSLPVRPAHAQAVYQAAGPTAASIQSTVDEFRDALGDNHGNVAQHFDGGRREINWDGNPTTNVTTPPITPFNTFLNTRGAQFTTPGTGLSQAPPSGGPAPRAALPCSSTIPLTPPPSARSAPRACSRR